MTLKFVEAIHQAVHRSGYSVKFLAAELNKAPSTLYDELNPMPGPDRTAKLGLEDAVQIMELIGDKSPLTVLNDHFDQDTRPRNVTPDQPDLHSEILDNHPIIVEYEQAMLNGESIEEVGRKREKAIRELEEDFVRYREQQSTLRRAK